MLRTRLIAFATVVAALAMPAFATAADKTYSLTLSPKDAEAGASRTYTATIKNLGTNQSLGSVNLTAPAPFDVTSALIVGGTASTNGDTVFLRNLNLAPGASRAVSMVVDTTAATGSWDWSSAAKQANDFNGTGNDFTLVGSQSQLTTNVNGGAGKSVECPEEPVGSTQTCRLSIVHSGATATGPYTVRASVVANPDAAGNAGQLKLALPAPRNISCPGVTFENPVTAWTDGPQGRSKTVRIVTDRADAITTLPPVCYAAPYPFATASPGVPFIDNGQVVFVGTLLDCAAGLDLLTPCVASHELVAGNKVLEVHIPGLLTDPWVRG